MPVFGCSGDFPGVPDTQSDIIGNQTMPYFGHHHWESFLCKETIKKLKNVAKIRKNDDFRHISASTDRKKFFLKKWKLFPDRHHYYDSLVKKSKKTNDRISRKFKKTTFSGTFPALATGKNFLSKIGLRHILGITILHHCAKNQKKLMSRSPGKLVTDERTNGHRLI